MFKCFAISVLAIGLSACSSDTPNPATPGDTITPALEALAEQAKPATLGVMMLDLKTLQARGVNIDKPLPMQSVFKLPLAIMVMHMAEQGSIKLDETLTLTKQQLSVAHSPIADAFGARQAYTIEDLVRAAVTQSDNTAADVLLARVGGPDALTLFFRERGIANFRVDRYEYEMQPQSVGLPAFTGLWVGSKAFNAAQAAVPIESQKAAMRLYLADPRDRLSPRDGVQILAQLDKGRLLGPEATAKMLSILGDTVTGADRLKAGIPKDAKLFHKTGTGGDVDGINSANNDIGIIQFADGRRIAVAVLLSGSPLPAAQRAAMIAKVAHIASTALAGARAVP